ncbi:cupin domain-containing protein [Salipiger sp. IMCC34102]|uniref:cupin domain-containing protein n=1 Tax=Salipiger sp. IMCC34102 TaxID=2510647 RepID=UPI00101CA8B7|nr:cupin domain-containing protein [Salipiger sp. IMCC34102]RYH03511.1 cupin domain-containing protein [Salipiger sp. IMCC34102]
MTDYLRTYPVAHPDAGVTRRVLSEAADLMVVSFAFERGAEGKLHDHPHVQSTYVREGRFRFTIAGEAFEVGPGDSFVIPSGARHGCVCLEPGELIDTFTPRRDDFL